MTNILILGATSAIAEEVAKNYAINVATLYLAARNSHKLERLSQDLKVRGAKHVQVFIWDALSPSHLKDFAQILEQIPALDILLIAHGAMPEESSEVIEQIYQVNLVSVVQVLESAIPYFRNQKKGTIAVVSSVAGERTRSSIRLYSSAKAGLSSYLSGLRAELNKDNIFVLTIKPGRIDTPMTAHHPKTILTGDVKTVATDIVWAIAKKKEILYTPKYWRFIMAVLRVIPEKIWKRLSL